jgi:hypothetical protein
MVGFSLNTGGRCGTASRIVGGLLLGLILASPPLHGQSPIIEPKVPTISETTAEGKRRTVAPVHVSNLEIELYQRFQRTDAPDELFAIDVLSHPHGERELTEIIVRGQEAELRLYPDDCSIRYFQRKLKADELAQLRRFVADKTVDRLPDYTTDICDGVEYGYFHLTKEGGSRLGINNPPRRDDPKDWPSPPAGRVYGELVELFENLANPEKLSVKYLNRRILPALDVMYAHPRHEIRAVWAKGEDVRVLVSEFGMTGQQWRSLRDGKLGPVIEQPDAFPPDAFLDPGEGGSFGLDQMCDDCQPWQVRWGRKSIRSGSLRRPWMPPATWICEQGQEPIRLLDGPISHQLVTQDGHWLVGTLDDKLICYDLVKRKTVPIDSPETAARFYALDYLPISKKVLLVRPWPEGPREPSPLPRGYGLLPPKCRLLDPATGTTGEAKDTGDAKYLRQRMHRAFQATSQPGVVWVSSGERVVYTMLGRFDMQTLRFRNSIPIDSLDFDSDQVWVDESTRRIYVVYRGHLLRLPLPKEVYDDWKDFTVNTNN